MPPVARSISDSSWGPANRTYVDPWDLENYAYIKRRYSTCQDEPVVSLSAKSDFYYVKPPPVYGTNGSTTRRRSLFQEVAGIEEQHFSNELYQIYGNKCQHTYQPNVPPRRYSSMTYMQYCRNNQPQHNYTSTEDMYTTGSYSSPIDATYCFPKSPPVATGRHISPRHPPTNSTGPSLVYVYQTPRMNKRHVSDCHRHRPMVASISDDYVSASDCDSSSAGTTIVYEPPSAEVLMRTRRYSRQPRHFGLSTLGHLKIDYSCNWSSLDRYVGHS